MPIAPTFPGVYIEEIPSGVRTIVGVATNIAAFLGRAVAGPTKQAITINSFADFDRQFGGLDIDYPMSYAVSDFYQNGGSQAIVVRLASSTSMPATVTVKGLNLAASSAGLWGNNLWVSTDTDGITPEVEKLYGLSKGDLFNLTIKEVVNGQAVTVNGQPQVLGQLLGQERFLNLVMPGSAKSPAARAQTIDRVLAQSSQLLAVAPPSASSSSSSSGAGASSSAASSSSATSSSSGAPISSSSATGSASSSSAGASSASPSSTTATGYVNAQHGSDGGNLTNDNDFIGQPELKTGMYALDHADLFNMLCIPPDSSDADVPIKVYQTAMQYCKDRRAMLIVDTPKAWGAVTANDPNGAANQLEKFMLDLNPGENGRNAALYFPRILESDPLSNGQIAAYSPCGVIAGVMARTDVSRGVWKAPAGIDATLNGIAGLEVSLTNAENGQLNPKGLNCLRSFPVIGRVVWGARTLRGADQLADDYKYVPVRRLALFLEESLYRGMQWVVFEPNDEPLWSQIRLNVGAFMHNLFIQGAFQGQTPADAYFVHCDKNTTTQNDINLGIVNVAVGFAPLKPAEFVVIQIQQIAGSIAT